MSEPRYYHILPLNGLTATDLQPVKVGQSVEILGDIERMRWGLHASTYLIAAIIAAPPSAGLICGVHLRGELDTGHRYVHAGSERYCAWMMTMIDSRHTFLLAALFACGQIHLTEPQRYYRSETDEQQLADIHVMLEECIWSGEYPRLPQGFDGTNGKTARAYTQLAHALIMPDPLPTLISKIFTMLDRRDWSLVEEHATYFCRGIRNGELPVSF